ncbi:MAG TPA: membrane protein insertase YidC, partial [Steroidobacteraceae bacterium]
MDTQRLILLFIFGFSLLMLWEAWDKEHRPKPPPAAPTAQQAVPAPAKPVPSPEAKAPASSVPAAAESAATGETLRVTTDLLIAEIDTLGGTLKRLELLRHKDSSDPSKNFVLLGPHHGYEAQSGITGEGGPNHRSLWRA